MEGQCAKYNLFQLRNALTGWIENLEIEPIINTLCGTIVKFSFEDGMDKAFEVYTYVDKDGISVHGGSELNCLTTEELEREVKDNFPLDEENIIIPEELKSIVSNIVLSNFYIDEKSDIGVSLITDINIISNNLNLRL